MPILVLSDSQKLVKPALCSRHITSPLRIPGLSDCTNAHAATKRYGQTLTFSGRECSRKAGRLQILHSSRVVYTNEAPESQLHATATNPVFWAGFATATVVVIAFQTIFGRWRPNQRESIAMSDLALEAASDAPMFTLEGMLTKGKVVKVYDGDTCTIIMPVKGELLKFNCRLKGINAPELKPTKDTPDREHEVAKAKRSQAALSAMILDKVVTVQCHKPEKYGRHLVEIWDASANGEHSKETSVNQEMVRRGFAHPFMDDYK